jgi:Xaa-Pro aminopeptidase
MWEYGERFRVHVAEFGGSGVGNLAIMRGERSQHLYGATGTREIFSSGEFNRMEYSVHSHGYWHTGARTVFEGLPDTAAKKAWADNLRLKKSAVDALITGNKASDVYAAVVQASKATGINFWQTGDVGHGVGSSEREAPFLALYDQTELAPNMVIVVAVYTYNDKQQLIVSKDTYLVTDGRPQLLTWYKIWDRLYALHGTSARHG